jgi:hypothetical protein
LLRFSNPDAIKEDEMGGACGTYGEKRNACRVWLGNTKERNHLVDLSVEGRIILK